MATLNLSTNGPSISKSYQSIISATAPTGPAAKSSTYGQWAIFSVSAPLVNAFQQNGGGKESVLKVQSTGGMCFFVNTLKYDEDDLDLLSCHLRFNTKVLEVPLSKYVSQQL